jgi:glycosyltransferase involved in cell wall biosynthesis
MEALHQRHPSRRAMPPTGPGERIVDIPVRVVHVVGRMQPGGVEMRLLDVMRTLRPPEFLVDVCALSGLSGSLDGEVRARGGTVFPLRLGPSFPGRFVRLLRERRYNVVHSHVRFSSGVILALAARADVPIRIAHFHGIGYREYSTLLRRAQREAQRLLIDRYATDIVACSEGIMNAIWRPDWHRESRCRVLYNGIDPGRLERAADAIGVRAELGIPESARLYAHVGNVLPVKNHCRLLDIFAELRRRTHSSWLLLAGAGTDDPLGPVVRGIRARGIHDRVVVLGVRHDVPRLLHAADALLLPSFSEGLPGVVLEACAVGVPVLATDVPGVREIASRLPLVRYLPLRATDAEWADAAAALPDEATRQQLRKTAPDLFRASLFHVDRAVAAHRALWNGVLHRDARRGADESRQPL